MSAGSAPWTGALTLRRPDPTAADRLASVLRPEAAREVPRSAAKLERPEPSTLRIRVRADDTGALRAALNAYLGWVQLALDTEAVARRAPVPGAPPAPGEALITATPPRD